MTEEITVESEATEETFEVEQEESPKKEDSGAQKRIKQLVRQRNEARETQNALASEVENLRNQLGSLMEHTKAAENANLNSDEQLLGDKVNLAKRNFEEAFESGNKSAMIDAQEAMTDASTDLKILKVRKAYICLLYTWFGSDKVMTAAAYAIDGEIRDDGIDPVQQPDRYYEEVDRRIRKEFPHKFDSAPSNAAQVVAGQSRAPATGKKVKLSQVEAATAKKLGIPLDKYAAEKAKMAGSDDYTVIG